MDKVSQIEVEDSRRQGLDLVECNVELLEVFKLRDGGRKMSELVASKGELDEVGDGEEGGG